MWKCHSFVRLATTLATSSSGSGRTWVIVDGQKVMQNVKASLFVEVGKLYTARRGSASIAPCRVPCLSQITLLGTPHASLSSALPVPRRFRRIIRIMGRQVKGEQAWIWKFWALGTNKVDSPQAKR
jgi:hypothetical protein